MEGSGKNKNIENVALLKDLLQKTKEEIKSAKKREKKGRLILKNLEIEEKNLRKERSNLLQKKKALGKTLFLHERKDAKMRAEKKRIEEKERLEKDPIKKRKIEKERWEVENRRRRVEDKKWKIEDKIKSLEKEIRRTEEKITEDVRTKKKKVSIKIKEIKVFLEKQKKKIPQIRKKIFEERKSILSLKSLRRKQEESQPEEKAEKEKVKKEDHLEKVSEERGETGKESEEKPEEKEELKEKIEELFDVIKKNKEEISSLREDLLAKEKERLEKNVRGEGSEEEKEQIDIIKEKVREEYEKLADKEKDLRSRENKEAIRQATREQIEEEKKQIDYIRDRVRAEQENLQGLEKDEKEEDVSLKEPLANKPVQKKDSTFEEKETESEKKPEEKVKKEDHLEKISEERGETEKEIEEEKKKLDEQEKRTSSKEEKEQIQKRKKEMEEEFRRLIKEETEEKWGKRISEVENEVAEVNKKYKELTEKEKTLRRKIEKIGTWGPESRRKKEEVDEYRSLYKKPKFTVPKENVQGGEEKIEVEKSEKPEEKSEKGDLKTSKIKKLFHFFKPSKDFFLKAPLLLGIDVSDYSVEIISINEKKKVNSFGRELLNEGVVFNGEIRKKEDLKKAFLRVFKNAKPYPIKKDKRKRIKGIVSLPESKVFVQQLKIKENEDVLQKVKEEIERTIPIPADDLYFYHHSVDLSEKKEKAVLCIAVEKRVVVDYVEFFRSIEVDPIVFDIEAASLGRVFLSSFKKENKKKQKNKKKGKKKEKEKKEDKVAINEMIADIGARTTTLNIFHNGHLFLSVSIPFGGAYFTERVAKKLDIAKEEAEKKKKELGVHGKTREVLLESLEKVVQEIKNAESYYNREFGENIEKIILVGGSSLIPGLLDYFKEELGENVEIPDPLERLKITEKIGEEEALLYANAIGLSLRATEKDPIENGFNLLPEKIKKEEKRYQRERKGTIRFLAVVLALLGFVALFIALRHPPDISFNVQKEETSFDELIIKEKPEKEEKEEIFVYTVPEGEEIVGTVSGEDYQILREVGKWVMIETEDFNGWVRKDDLD